MVIIVRDGSSHSSNLRPFRHLMSVIGFRCPWIDLDLGVVGRIGVRMRSVWIGSWGLGVWILDDRESIFILETKVKSSKRWPSSLDR